MPGDVVRRMIKGKDTQRGYCRDIELTACVQVIGTKQVLTDIKSEDLTPLQVNMKRIEIDGYNVCLYIETSG